MPLYTVQHACPLSLSQKDELALALTHIHSTKFTTPKNFVNVALPRRLASRHLHRRSQGNREPYPSQCSCWALTHTGALERLVQRGGEGLV